MPDMSTARGTETNSRVAGTQTQPVAYYHARCGGCELKLLIFHQVYSLWLRNEGEIMAHRWKRMKLCRVEFIVMIS